MQDSLEHCDPPKALRRVLQRMLHVLHHRLLPDCLLYPPLRLDVERICVKPLDVALLGELGLGLARAGLAQELRETRRVILSCCSNFWLCLDKAQVQDKEREKGLGEHWLRVAAASAPGRRVIGGASFQSLALWF